ncbi:hypothetical protein CRG98_027824 [Punica granatum]|uniref:Uncharacterized protein n=1 Tax=Punica granatum TaxID=22663 RepID=A0A2I0J7X7_PUNGR|nr:hypothetical protein CRG98_027824 [Punica granatum]
MELDKPNRALADTIDTREKTIQKETALPEAPDGILLQGRWPPTPKRPSEVTVVVVWFQSYRVDPYSPAKITKNRLDWAVLGSEDTTEAPDGILLQGWWLLTLKRPPEVTVVFV